MVTRHYWLAAFVVLGAAMKCGASRATEYTIDPERTRVSFEMRSMGTIQRGEFSRAAGTVTLDPEQERGEVAIVIDARSLEAASEATARFVRGPSMLDTEVHPQIEYRAQRIVFADGRPARIEGELTLLGVTRAVALDVSRYDCIDERCAIAASANVKRSAFGMTRYTLFASDEVKLAIRAEGVSRSIGTERW